jgi:hypothetical protein
MLYLSLISSILLEGYDKTELRQIIDQKTGEALLSSPMTKADLVRKR